jgi:two-component system cell cycle sensor histidine kinase PleC
VTGSSSATADGFRTRFRALAREIAVSYNPKSAQDLQLVGQQLALARQSSNTTIYILPVAAALISVANRDWVPVERMIAWTLLVTVACWGCEIYYRWMIRRIDEGSPEGIRTRARNYVWTTLISSFAWSMMLIFLWAPGEPLNHMFLTLVIASTISGWSSLGASHLASALVPMPMYLLMTFGMPIREGDTLDSMLAFLDAGYWIIMIGLLYANYKTRERILRLEAERGPLIDDLKRAKADSDRARDRAETASRAKSAFLANMSHELRTPLNAILGFSEIIHTRALGAAATDQYSEYGGFIHESGKHLLALINDILDLAKIEAGRISLREEEIDLSRLISEASQMLLGKATDGQIRLQIESDKQLPNVFADQRALRQITVNLLSNALKFTPPGGIVTVFSRAANDGGLCFGVSDTGVGIELEDQGRVFESFGQGRHDAVIADQGTGLGLPIVKGLAEAHDGRVSLESTPGKGTRVTVTLPASRIRRRAA